MLHVRPKDTQHVNVQVGSVDESARQFDLLLQSATPANSSKTLPPWPAHVLHVLTSTGACSRNCSWALGACDKQSMKCQQEGNRSNKNIQKSSNHQSPLQQFLNAPCHNCRGEISKRFRNIFRFGLSPENYLSPLTLDVGIVGDDGSCHGNSCLSGSLSSAFFGFQHAWNFFWLV